MGFRWRGVFGGEFDWGYPFPFTDGVNMNELFYSLSGCEFIATAVQTALAASKLRLFKSTLEPTPATPLADYVSAEADYTNYPPGGEALALWLAPILSPGGGYQIQAPMVQFVVGDPVVAGNVIGGFWIEEAGGELIAFGTFGSPQPMEVADQGIDLAPVLTFPTGA